MTKKTLQKKSRIIHRKTGASIGGKVMDKLISEFNSDLGKMPDSCIAKKAGCSPQ